MFLIFAGAGASKAVDGESYPTTVEFFKRLPKDITSDKIFSDLLLFLSSQLKAPVVDVEQVLWMLGELKTQCRALASNDTPLGWLFSGNRINNLMAGGGDHQSSAKTASLIREHVTALESNINRMVYDLYDRVPSAEQLDGNWKPLLQGSLERSKRVEVFTTNYDVVLETCAEEFDLPLTPGRTKSVRPVLETRLWNGMMPTSPKIRGLITKLHGSIDWTRGKGVIHVGVPTYRGRHDEHAILYPGLKGAPTDPLFGTLHEFFGKSLSEAKAAVFVGFAFRDEHINNIIRTRLNPQCHVIVLNPVKPPDGLVPVDRLHHVKERFDSDSTTKVLKVADECEIRDM